MSEEDGTADKEVLAEAPGDEIAESPAREQRQYHRYKVSFKVFVRLSGGDIVTAQAVDLSMGGVYIEYGASADVDKEYDIAFDLALSGEFKRVIVKAKIVRSVVVASRNVYGLALVFTDFARNTDKVLEEYLELRAKKTM